MKKIWCKGVNLLWPWSCVCRIAPANEPCSGYLRGALTLLKYCYVYILAVFLDVLENQFRLALWNLVKFSLIGPSEADKALDKVDLPPMGMRNSRPLFIVLLLASANPYQSIMLKFKNVPFLSSVEIIRDLRGRKLQPSVSINPPGQRGSGLQRRDGLGSWQVDRGPQRRRQTRRRRHLAAAARNFRFQIFFTNVYFSASTKNPLSVIFHRFFLKDDVFDLICFLLRRFIHPVSLSFVTNF